MFLVTGATGRLGRRVVQRLRQQNQPVRAFVRLTSRYGELEAMGAEIFVGDLLDERDLEKAVQGVRVIVSTHGSTDANGGDPQTLDYRANRDLIDLGKAAGVQQFIFLSVLGADRGYEDSPTFKAKREVEKHLERSGLTYTILRPSVLMSDLLNLAERFQQTGFYLLIGDTKSRTSPISTDDLAHIIVESTNRESAKNQIFAVGGPEVLTREELPRIFGKVYQREPIIINPPLLLVDGIRAFFGVVNPEAQEGLGTLRTLLANEFFCTQAEVERLETTFDLKLETLESFIRRYSRT
ncbi:MAG: SDR family oxidoreductase [Synechococcales bacterium]|nr:SDR family oxidoreductase [Synechococcales bacterium]